MSEKRARLKVKGGKDEIFHDRIFPSGNSQTNDFEIYFGSLLLLILSSIFGHFPKLCFDSNGPCRTRRQDFGQKPHVLFQKVRVDNGRISNLIFLISETFNEIFHWRLHSFRKQLRHFEFEFAKNCCCCCEISLSLYLAFLTSSFFLKLSNFCELFLQVYCKISDETKQNFIAISKLLIPENIQRW